MKHRTCFVSSFVRMSRYREACREKNRVIAELDTSYDQIEKLNAVLRGKEKEISLSRMGSSNIAERDVSPQNSWNKPEYSTTPYSPRPIVSPQQVNIGGSRSAKMPSSRIERSALRK